MAKWGEEIARLTAECARLRAEAATSAAQRDEAVLRATRAEEARRAVEANLAGFREDLEMLLSDRESARASARIWRRKCKDAEAELARRDAAERNHTTAGGAADA